MLLTPSRNGKLRLMREYFATTPDPERGWALAALTGELSFAEAKPSQVRDLAISRVDPELFGWFLDFVGDLAETVALIWPEAHSSHDDPHPPPAAAAGPPSPAVRERVKNGARPIPSPALWERVAAGKARG